ncbi:MAG TPA: 30S ribosomal protein S2 [Nitrospiraceae bacterium]|nr:MAG: 30S ribosomal protein S2 [Nitrospirae bacterium RIFCSPLOWO2_02_42_7]HBI24156.1 30S ribosomal protein S2 [Nitrospiraceae bacterium]
MVPAIKELLEAGVHFGHQKKRWNPKMKKFIFGERNGIYIIDLQKTLVNFGTAIEFIKDVAAKGKPVLFVGTKRQAQEIIEQEARKCGMFYINQRWLGGMLTNFFTIKRSIDKLRRFEKWQEDGTFEKLPKKEVNMIEKQMVQMDKILSGIKNMNMLPGAVFVVDTKKEYIAVHEAKRLGIPVVGIVDTNCDPENIDFVIPGNDDAIKAIKLICSRIADAVIEGRAIYDAKGGVKQEIPVSIPEAEMVPVSTIEEVVQEIPDAPEAE